MKPILEIKHVSKAFKIRHQHAGYLTVREQLLNIFRPLDNSVEDFYALDDVSIDVQEGDSLGVIGRNGAGKSTLLKIISKIVAPGKGKITTRGRIGCLLEVGTGFHPELTGRENIFFNGSLLGMRRREIQKNFDAIVEFSGVEKFLDTPLKHYSSGMQLRLAFSVAAFLEPEILIIDEVLAVGDAEFQKKCLSKMEDVHKSGRTILFVSHNMAAVQNLCKRGIVLHHGKISFEGGSADAVAHYLQTIEDSAAHGHAAVIRPENSIIDKVEILSDGKLSASAYMGCELEVRLYFRSTEALDFPVLGLIFKDSYSLPLLAVNNKHYQGNVAVKPTSAGVISMTIPYFNLFAGNYQVDVYFGNRFQDLAVLRDCFQVNVDAMHFTSAGELPNAQYNRFFIKEIFWSLTEHDSTD
jgi:lipopolysaccharide transport system ATP-binding protein